VRCKGRGLAWRIGGRWAAPWVARRRSGRRGGPRGGARRTRPRRRHWRSGLEGRPWAHECERASRSFGAARHLRVMAASPWPEATGHSRSVSADGSAEVESRDSRQKTRIAYMQCTSRALPREDPRPADLYADLHVSVQAHQRKLPLLALTAAVQYYPLRDCTCGISYGQERTRVAGIHSLNPPRFVNFPGSSLPQLIFPWGWLFTYMCVSCVLNTMSGSWKLF
jgi:hypothetical protein